MPVVKPEKWTADLAQKLISFLKLLQWVPPPLPKIPWPIPVGRPSLVFIVTPSTRCRGQLTYWNVRMQELIDSLELVQRRIARRTLHEFRRTTSAAALVSRLNLDTLQLRRTAAKATLMHKINWGQVEVKPREGVLTPKTQILRGLPSSTSRLPQILSPTTCPSSPCHPPVER